jgi:hypothetical protein
MALACFGHVFVKTGSKQARGWLPAGHKKGVPVQEPLF